MANITQKNIGHILVGFSIVLLVILTFVKINVDNRGAFLCEMVASSPHLDMSECPAHKDNTSWLIVGAFGIAFLVSGSGIYIILVKRKKGEFGKIGLSKLNGEEKRIFVLLKDNEGSMYQSDIIKETELSKVNVTRILDKMEGKNVLERKRRGMTNIIVLK